MESSRQIIGMRWRLGPSLAVHQAGRRQQVVGMCSCLGPSLAVCGSRQVVCMEFSIRSDYKSSSNQECLGIASIASATPQVSDMLRPCLLPRKPW